MLRYHPPKSNIWGHRLRKMKPSTERTLAGKFEEIAVARSAFGASSLMITRAADEAVTAEIIQRFELALGRKLQNGFAHLTEAEFAGALEVLISMEGDLADFNANLLLSKMVRIEAWRIAGASVPTDSSLHWNFGSSPCISTFLRFNDRAEYDFVRQTFADLKICQLNDKHLKPVKRPGCRKR